jgi:hypothetical protein
MNIFDFITQDELDELPEDSNMAFATFVRIAQGRLANCLRNEEGQDGSWQVIQEARYGFINVVVAAAKRYEIEPFSSLEVPRLDKFTDGDHRQFKADLDYYMTQLLLDNSIRGKRESVTIPIETKERIRTYIHRLKEAIDSADVTDAKRAALLDKLAEFEKELEKRRLNLLAVTKFAMAILATPGSIWGSYEIVQKLTSNVLQAVGEAKAVDDETRQLSPIDLPRALMPPRKDVSPTGPSSQGLGPDLDDEIPF